MPVDHNQVKVQLRNLREWRDAYYNGQPLVSDAIYDDVEDQVRTAATALPAGDDLKTDIDDFLARVGAPIPAGGAVGTHWVKVKHKAPAGSLNKAQGEGEFTAWHRDCLGKIGVPQDRLAPGTKVRTLKVPDPAKDWAQAAHALRRWGVEGRVLRHSDSHGLIFEVEHDDDHTTAWYGAELDVARGVWSEKADGISCFDGDTEILLANGELIPIRDLIEGDRRPQVLSWSPETGETVEQVVAVHDNGMRDNWVRITFDDGSSVLVTDEHLFYVPGEGWIQAKDIAGKEIHTTE